MNKKAPKVEALFFEDYSAGQRFAHLRGKTMTEMDNVLLTNLTMNSAHAHFNEEAMKATPVGQRVVFGGLTASLVVGLASQDTAENAIAELSMTGMRLMSPVVHGDTITAFSEVVEVRDAPDRPDAGIVTFNHWGMNQREQMVCQLTRTALIRRRTPR